MGVFDAGVVVGIDVDIVLVGVDLDSCGVIVVEVSIVVDENTAEFCVTVVDGINVDRVGVDSASFDVDTVNFDVDIVRAGLVVVDVDSVDVGLVSFVDVVVYGCSEDSLIVEPAGKEYSNE